MSLSKRHKKNQGKKMPKEKKITKTRAVNIEKEVNPFVKNLTTYLKHQGLEIELTLHSGKRLVVKSNRQLIDDQIIQFKGKSESFRVSLQDIRQADIYVV